MPLVTPFNSRNTWKRVIRFLGGSQWKPADNTDEALHDFPPPSHITRRNEYALGAIGPEGLNFFPMTADSHTYMTHIPVRRIWNHLEPIKTSDNAASIPAVYIGNPL